MMSTTSRPRIVKSDPEWRKELTGQRCRVNVTALAFAPQSDAPEK